MKTVASGRKHGLATLIPNHNLLTFSVNPYLDVTARNSAVFNVEPVRQVTLLPTFTILDADSIPCHRLHRQLSITKLLLCCHGDSTQAQ